jgi:AraC-like DNA-binding protein
MMLWHGLASVIRQDIMTRHLPLLRAGIIDTIILSARELGVPVEKSLAMTGLPDLPWGEEDPEQLLPLSAAMDFLEIVARREGFPLYGIHAATHLPLAAIRSLHLDMRHCANLQQVLLQFIARARVQGTTADYRLEIEGDRVWFRHRGHFPRSDALQSDLYTLGGMIEAVRLVAGPDWTPLEIEVTAKPSVHVLKSDYLGTDHIRFAASCRGIALPRELLAMKRPNWLIRESELPPSLTIDTLHARLEAVIPAYLCTGQLNEALIVRITGISFRTLKRQLAREGESYSRIVTRVRQRMAQQLLEQSGTKLREIAWQLGYSDLPNFMRAFRRWTGITPGEYRHLHQAGMPVTVTRARVA